ncbi:hypothetical protein MTO96_035971 [Rhipicephalus appendiculatus]
MARLARLEERVAAINTLSDTEFLAAFRNSYLYTNTLILFPLTLGPPNPDIDADISVSEDRAALSAHRTTSAPEVDRIATWISPPSKPLLTF